MQSVYPSQGGFLALDWDASGVGLDADSDPSAKT